jgi:hypothetical protein
MLTLRVTDEGVLRDGPARLREPPHVELRMSQLWLPPGYVVTAALAETIRP